MPAHDITTPAFSYDSGYVTISPSQYLEKTPCRTCQGFDPALRARAEGSSMIRNVPAISTTTSRAGLWESARCKPCYGCALLHAMFPAEVKDAGLVCQLEINKDWHAFFSDHPLYLFRLLVTFKVPPSDGMMGQILTCSFFVGPEGPSQAAPSQSKGLDTLPTKAIGLEQARWIEDRLSTCTKSHTACFQENPVLPTRVLDLGLESGHTGGLRILEARGERGQYACLSHCWGISPETVFRATTSNIEQLKESVDISKLTQTFQDAIYLVRRLGIPYIWIDSLCIIQDDKDDWRAEASRMCSVYENAHITIAATGAKDGSHGLYSYDASSHYVGRKIATIDSHEVHVRRAINHAGLHVYLDQRDCADYPLLGRGWVYQERLLSRRFLQFSRFELTWECLGGNIRCQCGYARWASSLLMKKTFLVALQQLTRDEGGGDTESAAWRRLGLSESWRYIVSQYSCLALSHASDRFSALAGLAYRFREALADEYLAGLWRGSLVQDLQWHALEGDNYGRLPPRPTGPWRAPSWSWAAVDGPVDYDRPPLRVLQDACDVRAARCDFVDDALSELRAGFVRLRGLLVRSAVLEVRDEGGGNARVRVAGVALRSVWLDYARPPVNGMPVALFRVAMLDVGDIERTKWLILCCVDGTASTAYERIGIAEHDLLGAQSVDLEGATVEEILIV